MSKLVPASGICSYCFSFWSTLSPYLPIADLSSVKSLSRVQLFVTPWTAARQASLSITNSQSLLKHISIESVMPSSHLILCNPLLLLPSIFPSIRVFSNKSALHIRWPKFWSFSFNISHSNEHSGVISFRMDWLDLLAVQGTFKSLLQHHSSKASILWHSAFFIAQLSHIYSVIKNNEVPTHTTTQIGLETWYTVKEDYPEKATLCEIPSQASTAPEPWTSRCSSWF